ncbi:MAG: hypothetical protein ACRD2X_05545 [Vicinamibacteraceae bacterium]
MEETPGDLRRLHRQHPRTTERRASRDIRFKQFDEGIKHLEEEGLMQVVFPAVGRRESVLGVVGQLQFDVVEARLRGEYGVSCEVERLSYAVLRWVSGSDDGMQALELAAHGVLQPGLNSTNLGCDATMDNLEWRVNCFAVCRRIHATFSKLCRATDGAGSRYTF